MEYQALEYNILHVTNSELLIPISKTQSIICVEQWSLINIYAFK